VNDRITSVGDFAFAGALGLKSVTFTNEVVVGERIFSGCTSLKKVRFEKTPTFPVDYPLSVAGNSGVIFDFNDYVEVRFRMVAQIRNHIVLRYEGGVCPLQHPYIDNGYGDYQIIYVPSALIDSYPSSTNWVETRCTFRAIEDYTVDGTVTGELDYEKMGVSM
jgi:hypothetical protein